MQDLLLLVSVAAVFVWGWFLMKRLDCFLEEIYREQVLRSKSGRDMPKTGPGKKL